MNGPANRRNPSAVGQVEVARDRTTPAASGVAQLACACIATVACVIGVPAGEVDLDGAESLEQLRVEVRAGKIVERERVSAHREAVDDRLEAAVDRGLVRQPQHHAVRPDRRDPERQQQLARYGQVRNARSDELLEADDAEEVAEQPDRRYRHRDRRRPSPSTAAYATR